VVDEQEDEWEVKGESNQPASTSSNRRADAYSGSCSAARTKDPGCGGGHATCSAIERSALFSECLNRQDTADDQHTLRTRYAARCTSMHVYWGMARVEVAEMWQGHALAARLHSKLSQEATCKQIQASAEADASLPL